MKQMIEQATNLPSIPQVLQKLIATMNDEDTSTDKLATIISNDQTITAKVLRLANSVHFGRQRKVGSVKDALVVLGRDTLRTLVLSIGLVSSFKAPATFDLNAFWRRSFMLANRAKWLAKLNKSDPEIAYTCGLLHGIGEYLIHIIEPELAKTIDEQVEGGAARRKTQLELFGFDYTMAGSELARYWKFPDDIADAILWQQQPAGSGALLPYATLLYLARYMILYREQVSAGNFDELPVKLIHAAHMNLDDTYSRMRDFTEDNEDIMAMLQQ
ncbi:MULTISPECIES: HDOD domain-containing protein [unclassified Arsukibacterium]|uniref:HDOD domain-containing protein n=1 Tax=unclassified Arsukibacterium TaxID=2635278 RepID=UPI000C558B55|nr:MULTISPECIES: HDOD domain-containing protein [unclassified Arsukibacterium]MAA95186.1 HDOD domain-containing protein [Rheinheimera sp.]MBM35139.1 HDOD domain-containing protein [Rheinheimera sp.]HAW93510.1 HDOD domain-containing protein [Candidatus Azambacteria bacterium]|tara:strand:- start:141 stop:956 length:816 start_codon:yes stop_codon:yes gene_type:complete